MTDEEFFARTDFSCEITGSGSEIEILPYIDVESDRARTLIASFEVDSLEMIESARIPLSAGKNHVPFQQTVRIVKPLLWQPKGTGMPSRYTFSVIFHRKGAPFHQIDKPTGVRFIEASPDRRSFRINGRDTRLVRCGADPGVAGKGNTVCFGDTDPDLKSKLDSCAEQGLIAVLNLTGCLQPEQIAGLPGICLLTAEADSEVEKRFRSCRIPQLPPLVGRRELDGWMADNG